ncbi:Wadjet anti-phage system protein JetD domain-containing protein [Salinisphaera hydrothermalis]|uniref:Wadjet protein JetD C-terminal domain-containing protein n=1 Tax=Salinisphaera hydrothermalis (strain C41B8) TaxID=1304275 RepID=A0A084IM95_SALHC|nr:Wadjet anti-phage system protein JetD domain-containing protein [Salinisphaera hydrothermalis]KEZ77829.1 hypothetical protein C41B8_08435 [Salinisphaera hydrothermalis C41B8]
MTSHAIAHKALSKLLDAGTRRRIRTAAGDTVAASAITVVFSEAKLPEYIELDSSEELERVHAEIREAERAGALRIEWDSAAGRFGQISRIVLSNIEALASFLNVTPQWVHIERAMQLSTPWRGQPAVDAIRAAWVRNTKVRNLGPRDAERLVEACRVLDRVRQATDAAVETPVRRLSADMFGDTKHIENALVPILDELTRGDEPPVSEVEAVLPRIGLVKHPQTLLIGGRGTLVLTNGQRITLTPPYLGIAPDQLARIDGPAPDHVLTIENLTTFNEVSRGLNEFTDAMVIYTAGMPSPSLRRALRCIAKCCSNHTRFWHWGDIDEGGLRIAKIVAASIAEESMPERILRPWLMDPCRLPETVRQAPGSYRQIRRMVAMAEELGWCEVATGIREMPSMVEQEAISPRTPF